MAEGDKHIVKFEEYCKSCMFWDVSSTKEPCDSCLEVAARTDSRKPEKYVEKARGIGGLR